MGREGPELYTNSVERLVLYVSNHFKNGSDAKKCLINIPELAENHKAHKKEYGSTHMGELIKTKRVLKENLCNDSDVKNHALWKTYRTDGK